MELSRYKDQLGEFVDPDEFAQSLGYKNIKEFDDIESRAEGITELIEFFEKDQGYGEDCIYPTVISSAKSFWDSKHKANLGAHLNCTVIMEVPAVTKSVVTRDGVDYTTLKFKYSKWSNYGTWLIIEFMPWGKSWTLCVDDEIVSYEKRSIELHEVLNRLTAYGLAVCKYNFPSGDKV